MKVGRHARVPLLAEVGKGMPLRIAIVDDNELFRKFLRYMVARIPQAVVAGEAPDGQEAVRLIAATRPDLAIIDIEMPVLNGLEATLIIKRMVPHTRVMVISAAANANEDGSVLRCGADCFLPKAALVSSFLGCVQNLMSGDPAQPSLPPSLRTRPDA